MVERLNNRFLHPDQKVERVLPRTALVLVGPPTSGKSTIAVELATISGAQIIRGRQVVPELVGQYGEKRRLIPDDIFIPRMVQLLNQASSGLVVFDNIPRTPTQAVTLKIWAEQNGVALHVIKLDLTLAEVQQRAAERSVCRQCGRSYHPQINPPDREGICNYDGVSLDRRPGDDPATIEAGYHHHQTQDCLVLEALSPQTSIHRLSASGTVAEVRHRLITNLPEVILADLNLINRS